MFSSMEGTCEDPCGLGLGRDIENVDKVAISCGRWRRLIVRDGCVMQDPQFSLVDLRHNERLCLNALGGFVEKVLGKGSIDELKGAVGDDVHEGVSLGYVFEAEGAQDLGVCKRELLLRVCVCVYDIVCVCVYACTTTSSRIQYKQ